MTKRQIKKNIYAWDLRSSGSSGYCVMHAVQGEYIVCEVPKVEIAHTIVRALRERALKKIK